jgi:dipeptidyl aminopeptidase/acylaminoacyl peptidase
MPWDAAELWAAGLADDGDGPRLVEPRRVAGGRAAGHAGGLGRPVSVCLPEWSPDGRLWWCADTDDWWRLYVAPSPGVPEPGAGDLLGPVVADRDEEVGEPRWVAGGRRYGFTDDGRVVMAAASGGLDRVWVLDPATGAREPLPGPAFTSVESLCVRRDVVVVVAGHARHPTSVWRVDLGTGEAVDLRAARLPVPAAWVAEPEPITFCSGRPGDPDPPVAHALLYRPRSGDHVGPDGERPPLVVRIHGGPTAAARAEFSTSVQFWTTRGFAVVDVDYRGSVGHGRAYRDALRGNWGVADVEDCLAVTRHLAAAGEVDGDRCVIRGGSSGGFTALAALCNQARWGYPGAFAAACSLYGVTDLSAMAADTHKFESRYLDGLVAPLPDGAAVYRERSPLHHAARLDRPVLLLQGSEDQIVPPSQAEVLVAALRAKGVPHRYLLFHGEGHGFHRTETVVRALEAELGFYGAVLGFEPPGVEVPELD